MRILFMVLLGSLAGFLVIGCSQDRVSTPTENPVRTQASDFMLDPDQVASEIILATNWELGDEVEPPAQLRLLQNKALPNFLTSFERTELLDDIVHYSFEIQLGFGPYEKIRLHRVVRERRPYRPIRTHRNLFALHGSPGNFPMMFLFGAEAPSVPDDQALAIYLARQDVDVWGMDRPGNFVPAEETDFSFMAGWDLQFNVDALRTGMAIARLTRLFTGGGLAPLNLLGYSSGVPIGYAALNHEAALPRWARQIGGFIPVDNAYKFEPGPGRDRACETYTLAEEALAAGNYAGDFGILFNTISILARTDPEGDSPIVPGFNNHDASLFIGAMTWMIFVPPVDPPPHFFTGVFDEETGLPVDLAYTEFEHYLDFLMLPAPYEEMAIDLDVAAIGCDQLDVPFDDFLGQVEVPIMYVGAAGGVAPEDSYTLSLLGSEDITTLTAQLLPPEAALLDIGHVDLFTSDEAIDLVWEPILNWVVTHSRGGCQGGGINHRASGN